MSMPVDRQNRGYRDLGGQARFVRCDVSRAADCQGAVQAALAEFGRLDILFNNAGIIRRADVLGTSEEEWERVMAVNVKSIFLMSKFAIPEMIKLGGGAIINTSSGWGIRGGVTRSRTAPPRGRWST